MDIKQRLIIILISISILTAIWFACSQLKLPKNIVPPSESDTQNAEWQVKVLYHDKYLGDVFTVPLNQRITVYNMTPSNSPDGYLDSYIAWTIPSEWMTYQPLIDKVKEITKGLTSDYDKMIALARWVKHSRPYSKEHTVQLGTIIEQFDSPGGICYDAANILTAMLRVAGIPARSVTHQIIFHQFTEAYVDGKWYQIDATFGEGEPIIWDSPRWPGSLYKHLLTFRSDNDTYHIYTHAPIVYDSVWEYGSVIFPITSVHLFCAYPRNPEKTTIYRIYDELPLNARATENLVPTTIRWRLEAKNENHYLPMYYYKTKHASVPGFYGIFIESKWENAMSNTWYDNASKQLITRYSVTAPIASGFITFDIPVGKYRLHYFYSYQDINVDTNKMMYIDFEVKSGEAAVVDVSNARMVEGANINFYNVLFDEISAIAAVA